MTNLLTIAVISTALQTNWVELGRQHVADKYYDISVGRIFTNHIATFDNTNIAPVILKSEPSDNLVFKWKEPASQFIYITNMMWNGISTNVLGRFW